MRERERPELTVHFSRALVLHCIAQLTGGAQRPCCLIKFEAATQDDAVSQGWASLDQYKEHFDLWAFAREGLMGGIQGEDDVLVVAAWTHGMPEPIMFIHRFLPKAKGGFALVGVRSVTRIRNRDVNRRRL